MRGRRRYGRIVVRPGSLTVHSVRTEEGSVEPRDSTDDRRKAMLRAIHGREGRWDEINPETEVTRMGEGIGLGEGQSYQLFGHPVDKGFVEPGRAYRTGALCRVASAGSSDTERT
jgi:hypothetical protein